MLKFQITGKMRVIEKEGKCRISQGLDWLVVQFWHALGSALARIGIHWPVLAWSGQWHWLIGQLSLKGDIDLWMALD